MRGREGTSGRPGKEVCVWGGGTRKNAADEKKRKRNGFRIGEREERLHEAWRPVRRRCRRKAGGEALEDKSGDMKSQPPCNPPEKKAAASAARRPASLYVDDFLERLCPGLRGAFQSSR